MSGTVRIEPFCSDDITHFLVLAAVENWVADTWEFDFLLSAFPLGCFVARLENGEAAGYVTSLCHERSGWIGNLIVAEELRGRGIGEKLFAAAHAALRTAGVATFWLTASSSGAPLYEKYGFTAIDTIIRQVGIGRQWRVTDEYAADGSFLTPTETNIDYLAWGDRRDILLAATVGRGRVLRNSSGFLVLQPGGDSVQFGPFSALHSAGAERLFRAAWQEVALSTQVVVDTPVSNRAAQRLFKRNGMKITGSNLLMCAGKNPAYRPELIYGLATMGSCG
jgi:ribosomal protein S18 acetylase RimI-like enzyme